MHPIHVLLLLVFLVAYYTWAVTIYRDYKVEKRRMADKRRDDELASWELECDSYDRREQRRIAK